MPKSKKNIYSVKLIKVLFFLILFFLQNSLEAKNLKRKPEYLKIKTSNFDIIFRVEFIVQAQRIANSLEYYFKYVSKSLNQTSLRVPVVIWNRKTTVNSSTVMKPPMVNLEVPYPQIRDINGTADWIDLLCLHEFRHIVQNNTSYNYGFGKYIYMMFGTPVPWTKVPNWIDEGDAVGIETALSHGGRGRLPEFMMLYKANTLERKFSYDKAIFGSYKHKVTDEYPLGYHLTTYLRKKYGKNIIERLHKRGSTFPYCILPFDMTVKKETGISMDQLYKNAVEDIRNLWKLQLEGLEITNVNSLNKKDRVYTDYFFPQRWGDKIIALKIGIANIPKLVLFDGKKEKTIREIGKIEVGKIFSVSNNKITWAEKIRHPRWETIEYAVIKVYDLNKRKTKTITYKTKYKAPSLSPNGKKIATVETDNSYNHKLVILDSENGKVLKKLKNELNDRYITPKWNTEGDKILVIKCRGQKNSLVLLNIETEEEKTLVPFTTQLLNNPIIHKNYIYYHSPYSGIDNIYALDINTNKVHQVTSRKYGAFNPTISKDGKYLIFNDFTKDGMDVVTMKLDAQNWIPLDKVEDRSMKYYITLLKQENTPNIVDNVPNKVYKFTRYKQRRNILNIYGINFWPIDLESSDQTSARFFITAQDPLNTYEFKATYRYLYDFNSKMFDFKNNPHYISLEYTYKALFPEINIRLIKRFNEYQISEKYDKKKVFDNSNILVKPKLTIPLVTNIGNTYGQKINIGTQFDLVFSHKAGVVSKEAYKPIILVMSNLKKGSHRDIAPRWGQKFVFIKRCPADDTGDKILFDKSIDSCSLQLYFPGILKHHSFQIITVAYRDRGNEYEKGSPIKPYNAIAKNDNLMINPKYYRNRVSNKLLSIYITYDLPLWYPDIKINPMLYIDQVRLKFITSTYIDLNFEKKPGWHIPYFDCAGASILFDFKVFRLTGLKITVGALFMYTKEHRMMAYKNKALPFALIPMPLFEISS